MINDDRDDDDDDDDSKGQPYESLLVTGVVPVYY